MERSSFWSHLDTLVANHTIVIDRPHGTAHPRYPDFVYPLDYGYLADTLSMDGSGVDVWVGSLPGQEDRVTGAVCTVDLVKQDTEVKILIRCTEAEAELILATHNTGPQAAVLVSRPSDHPPT